MNTLHKASLNHFRVVSVSVCVKPTPPHRLDLGVRGRMRRRAKPGGEVAGGDGKADRKGPRGAKVAARRKPLVHMEEHPSESMRNGAEGRRGAKLMKPVPHGEPYAGNLHVRFAEG